MIDFSHTDHVDKTVVLDPNLTFTFALEWKTALGNRVVYYTIYLNGDQLLNQKLGELTDEQIIAAAKELA